MKKSARLKTTARLFLDKDFEAATATLITSEGHITDPLSYCPFKGKEYLFSRILKKGLDLYRSVSKPMKKHCIVIGL